MYMLMENQIHEYLLKLHSINVKDVKGFKCTTVFFIINITYQIFKE